MLFSLNPDYYARNNYAAPAVEGMLKNLGLLGGSYFTTEVKDEKSGLMIQTAIGAALGYANSFTKDYYDVIALRQKYFLKKDLMLTDDDKTAQRKALDAYLAEAGISDENKKEFKDLLEISFQEIYQKGYPAWEAEQMGAARMIGSVVDTTHCSSVEDEGYQMAFPGSTMFFSASDPRPLMLTATGQIANALKVGFRTIDSLEEARRIAGGGGYVVPYILGASDPAHLSRLLPGAAGSAPMVIQAGERNGFRGLAEAFGRGDGDYKDIKYLIIVSDEDLWKRRALRWRDSRWYDFALNW